MYMFLVPLIFGFMFNSASAYTTFYTRHLGKQGGRLVCILLRDLVGIPVWALGYAMAVWAPSTLLFTPSTASSVLACLLLLAGVVIILASLVSIRWRAAAPSSSDTLVAHGLYAYIRHPLYAGMIPELIGLFLWVPKMTVMVACILGFIWVTIQARLEEMDLVDRLPAYKDYMRRVPRFIPRLRRS